MSIKLSDVIQALHKDDELSKIAAVGGPTNAASEVARVIGSSKEDQKAQIATKMMELAGGETEGASRATTLPLNAHQQAPAGSKVTPEGVHTASAQEMGDVVGEALSKLENDEERKLASKKIIEKIAALGIFQAAEELKDVKGSEKKAEPKVEPKAETKTASETDWDAAGRLMARGYHAEILKLAEEDCAKIEAAEKTEKEAAEKATKAEAEKTAAPKAADLSAENQAFLDSLLK